MPSGHTASVEGTESSTAEPTLPSADLQSVGVQDEDIAVLSVAYD